jgi:ribonuclease HI
MNSVLCYFDGSCGPTNPGGHAGCGALVLDGGKTLYSKSTYIGHGPEMSNNVAEYAGICSVFEFLLSAGIQRAVVRGDSQMVIRQLQGKMRARKGLYIKQYRRARDLYWKLLDNEADIRLEWVRRDENAQADYLAGQAIKDAPRGNKRNSELVRLVKQQRADARDRNIRFDHAVNK